MKRQRTWQWWERHVISASRVIFYYLPDIGGDEIGDVYAHNIHRGGNKVLHSRETAHFSFHLRLRFIIHGASTTQVIRRGCETTPRKVARDKLLRGITLLFEYRSDVNNTWRYYSLVHCLASRCSSFLHKVFTNRSFLSGENNDPSDVWIGKCFIEKKLGNMFHEHNIYIFFVSYYLFISLLFTSLLVLSFPRKVFSDKWFLLYHEIR